MAITTLSLVGCSDFLDRPSKTTMDDSNYWVSEDNVRLFVNGGYMNYFVGYNQGWGQQYAPGVYSSGEFSDDGASANKQNSALQAVPASNYYKVEDKYWLYRTAAAPWNFAWVRKWNTLIERLATMKEKGYLSDEAYNHWNGCARFFRAFEYSRLVESFGDVPYYDHVVASADWDDQYKARDPRTEVMTKVMDDFVYAVNNIRANDGTNFLNKYVAAVFASRCLLFEGTWYKYHPGSGTDALAKEFLTKAMEFSKLVLDSGKYAFDTDFKSLFGGESQSGTETIMYRSYSASLLRTHCIASYCNLSEGQPSSANLWFLKSFICNDGKPYSSSSVSKASSFAVADMAKTRDPRFEATFWDEPTKGNTGVYCVKFIDRVGPTYAYNGQSLPAKYGSSTNTNGCPVVRLAEAALNYIEAKRELQLSYGGTAVTQSDVDITINAIRDRPLDAAAIAKGVTKTAHLNISSIPDDPIRTSDVEANTLGGIVSDPLLWEIRRERRMEFFMEQFRALDIRRWGKLELMQGSTNPDLLVGAWVDLNTTSSCKLAFDFLTKGLIGTTRVMKADGTIVTWNGTNAADMVGYYVPVNVTDRDPLLERNYLEPICTDVIGQYEDKGYTISQNPGW